MQEYTFINTSNVAFFIFINEYYNKYKHEIITFYLTTSSSGILKKYNGNGIPFNGILVERETPGQIFKIFKFDIDYEYTTTITKRLITYDATIYFDRYPLNISSKNNILPKNNILLSNKVGNTRNEKYTCFIIPSSIYFYVLNYIVSNNINIESSILDLSYGYMVFKDNIIYKIKNLNYPSFPVKRIILKNNWFDIKNYMEKLYNEMSNINNKLYVDTILPGEYSNPLFVSFYIHYNNIIT